MPTRRAARLTALLVATLLLAGAPIAHAQPAPPPPVPELEPPHPWTYQVMEALALLAGITVLALAVGYLVKAREFRMNQRRGGSK